MLNQNQVHPNQTIGAVITVQAPVHAGYVPDQASITLTLDANSALNLFIFHYTAGTGA